MADPEQIQLLQTYQSNDLAEDYARTSLDREWQEYLQREQAGAGTGVEVRGAPGQGTADQPTPSAVVAGAKAAGETALSGVQNVAAGMFEDRPGQMLIGGLELASALPAGAGAAVRQAFKNWAPGMEAQEAIPAGQTAGILRTFMSVPGLLLDPAQVRAVETTPQDVESVLSAAITYGELSDIVTQLAVPFLPKAARATAARVKGVAPELLSERGAIGRPTPPGGPPEGGAPTTFTTAKGSTYTVQPDGTTIRNKAARPEHPGDVGIQPVSERTFYVDEAAVNALGEFQTRGGAQKIIAQRPDGSWGIQYTSGPNAGKFERRTVVQASDQPAVGLYPVELWNGGREVHFGNKITDVQEPAAPAAPSAAPGGAAPPEGPPPPAAPPGPAPEGEVPGRLVAPEGAEARINLRYQQAPEGAQRVMETISKIVGEERRLQESRRVVSHEETIAEARKWGLGRVLATEPGDLKLTDVRGFQHATRDYFNAASQHVDQLVERIAAGDLTAEAEWPSAKLILGRLAELQEMPGTELARGLEARKIPATAARAAGYTPEAVSRLAELTGTTAVDPRVDAARYKALGTKEQRTEWLRQSWETLKTGTNLLHELWINNLLTNPVTHAANVTGTGLSVAWNLPEHAVAEVISRLFTRDPEGIQRGETAAMIRAIPQAFSDGIRLAGTAAAKETGREVSTTGAESALLGRTRVEVDQQLPAVLRVPTIALGIEDAAFKGITYRMELAALALREARAEGKTGAALEARVRELEASPPKELLTEAVDQAMLRTLNAELGPTGQMFMRWANSVPGGRLVLPFIRTPTNAMKWFGQRTPILAQLSFQNWRDMMAGGAARDKAIARQLVGGAVSAVIAYEVAQGNISGGGDPDRRLKSIEREEKPPYSIRIGGTWYAYSRLDPVGAMIGLIADYAEITGRIPTQDDLEAWAAHGEGLALAVGHVMVNKTYMRGLADVLEAMKDPQRNVGTVASGFARSIVPAGARAVTRQMDDNILRDARGLVDQIKSGIPYWAEDIPPVRNPITGEPFKLPPGWGPDMISPIFLTEQKNDPVFQEILANRTALPEVPRYVGPGERQEGPMMQEPRGGQRAIKLTPRQRDFWIVAMTHEVKLNGNTLHEALTDLVQSPRYQIQSTGPGGGRDLMLRTVYNAYKDAGEMALRRASPTLEPALRRAQEERVKRLLPVTDPRSPQRGAAMPAFGR